MLIPVRHDDLDIKIPLGPMLINIIYINYEPPVPSWGYPNHSHSSYELHFVTQGRGLLEVSGRRFIIEPGTLYLTGPGVYHKQLADAEEPMDEYCINFEIKVGKRKRHKSDTFLSSETDGILYTLQNTSFWFGKDAFGTVPLFRTVMQEFEKQMLGHYALIQSLATQIIIHAVRNFSIRSKSDYHIPKKILHDSRRFLCDQYFQDPAGTVSSGILASKIGVSVRQLERMMNQYYGMTFQKKLLQTRMEQAKDLLLSSSLPVSAVGEKVGYGSPSYFSKCFRGYTGLPPALYRETARKNK